MSSQPETPQKPKVKDKPAFWPPDSPIKSADRQASLEHWKDVTELIKKQSTDQAKQDVLNSNLVFLHRLATEAGLKASMKDALRASTEEEKDPDAFDTDSDSTSGSDSTPDDEDDLSYRDERQARQAPKDKAQPEIADLQSALVKLVLPLSPRFNVDALEVVRQDFVQRLEVMEIQVQEKGNGPWVTKSLRKEEIADFTNLLFNELWGMPALRNVAAMVNNYNEGAGEFGDAGLPVRASIYGQQEGVPEVCRRVVLDLGRCVELGSKHNQAFRGLRLNLSLYDLLNSYRGLLQSLKNNDQDVRTQMQKYKVETGRGHSIAGQARAFLVASTASATTDRGKKTTAKNVINNNISAAQALAELFTYHGGDRVAALMPANLGRRLVTLGAQKTAAVLDVYKDVCDGMKDDMDQICQLANLIIVRPVREGKPSPFRAPVAGSQKPLLTRMLDVAGEVDVEMED